MCLIISCDRRPSITRRIFARSRNAIVVHHSLYVCFVSQFSLSLLHSLIQSLSLSHVALWLVLIYSFWIGTCLASLWSFSIWNFSLYLVFQFLIMHCFSVISPKPLPSSAPSNQIIYATYPIIACKVSIYVVCVTFFAVSALSPTVYEMISITCVSQIIALPSTLIWLLAHITLHKQPDIFTSLDCSLFIYSNRFY